MDENQDVRRDEIVERTGPTGAFWVAVFAFVILAAAGAGLLYYNYQQRTTISQLTSQATGMNATISQLQERVDSATAKLNEVSAAQEAANQAAANAAKNGAARPGGVSRAEAARLKQLQANLDEQKKQLQSTQDDVAKNRTDLEGNINSTRDELNGSIAKTHDELVALEKRGERSYFEFDASRSKGFQRTGPVSISLRRADPKHANIDMVVLINDRQISKKKVNLYEPVWIYQSQDSQPVQVVVNKIDKDAIHGYISAPKYTPAQLAASASASTPAVTPVSQH